MVELLKQGQYRPYHVTDQIISIYAGSQGFLDDLPVNKVGEFEEKLLAFFRDEHHEIWQELTDKGDLDAALEARLREKIEVFKKRFTETHKAPAAAGAA